MRRQDEIRKPVVKLKTKSKYKIEIDDNYEFFKLNTKNKIISFFLYYIIGFLFGIIFLKILNSHRIYGKENIKELKNLGFISIANHCHYLDMIMTASVFVYRMLWFTSAQRNFETPFLRKILKIMNVFPIPDNSFGLNQIVKPVAELIENKQIVHLYPEQEIWHLSLDLGGFQNGAFYLSHKINCPLVPVVHLFKPKKFFGIKISKNLLTVKTIIGKPLYPKKNIEGEDGVVDMNLVNEMKNTARNWMIKQIDEYKLENKKYF